jgi:hypothetical protein
MWKQLEPHF